MENVSPADRLGAPPLKSEVADSSRIPRLPSARAFGKTTRPWILIGSVLAGALNYLFGLSMTGLLKPTSYSLFASGQALVLIAGTIANTSVPWLMAREIARKPEGSSSAAVVRFGLSLNLILGFVAAVVTAGISLSYATPAVSVWLGVSSLLFFLASTGMGWAQGYGRFGILAALIVAEVAVKVGAGALLVASGAGAAGAFAGTALGAAVITVAMIKPMWPDLRGVSGEARNHLWRAAAAMGGVQAGVTVLSVMDVLFISLHFGITNAGAQYQLSATLTRVPLFVALALATAAFPSLAERSSDRQVLSGHLEHLLSVLIPIFLLVATVPGSVIRALLPAGYQHAVHFFPLTVAISTIYAVVLFQTTVFRATGIGEKSLRSLGLGVLAAVAFMALGSSTGIFGAGVGALVGAFATATALAIQTERRWPGTHTLPLRRTGLWTLAALALVAARSLPVVWIVLAAVAGLVMVRSALRVPSFTAQPEGRS